MSGSAILTTPQAPGHLQVRALGSVSGKEAGGRCESWGEPGVLSSPSSGPPSPRYDEWGVPHIQDALGPRETGQVLPAGEQNPHQFAHRQELATGSGYRQEE